MDICRTCFMLLFRLPTVELLHAGALQRRTAPRRKKVNIQVQPFKRVYRCFKEYIFFFSCFPMLRFAGTRSDLQLTLLHHLKETHILNTPGRSITSSVSPEGDGITRVPFLSGGEIHTTEESGRAQKHMIGWQPWPHTHGDATKWLPHAEKVF